MAWSRNSNGIETLDLTLLSSPSASPEPRPQPHPHPRSVSRPTPSIVKAERAPHSSIKTDRVPQASLSRVSTSAYPTRPGPPPQRHGTQRIHPNDLASIVNTSDQAALRKVLLQLCDSSPALSGAVARGLAPHSSYAQRIIKRQRERGHAIPGSSKIESRQTISTYPARDNTSFVPAITQSIKREPILNLDPSDTESGSDSGNSGFGTPPRRIPGSFPTHNAGSTPFSSARFTPWISSPGDPATPPNKSPSRTLYPNIPNNGGSPLLDPCRFSPLRCIVCNCSFMERNRNKCRYHPGTIEMRRVGNMYTQAYTCCNESKDNQGCTLRMHVSASNPVKRPAPETPPFRTRPPKNSKFL
ncbi:hypothetical protein B0J11DRAFT_508057 [Dendryphion nanum]|uniref:Uncharacterized protein n=1 Tax=Dendryphion nanum TaxID=256645 RepID=A0A9P9IHP9_9PLEO|nr:hypothetical protein B0J11DRAFT_508057 [Dendryphion nanum]